MALRSREHLLSWPSILSLEALVCSASTLNSDTKCIGDDTERPIYDTSKAGDACDTSPCTATECCKAASIGINTYSEHCEVLVRLGVLGRLGSFRLIRSPQEHYQKRSRIIRSPQESSRALTNHQEPSRSIRSPQDSSEALKNIIRSPQKSSGALKNHQEPSRITRSPQESSGALKTHQEPSRKSSGALKTHQEPLRFIKSPRESSGALMNHQEHQEPSRLIRSPQENHQEPS